MTLPFGAVGVPAPAAAAAPPQNVAAGAPEAQQQPTIVLQGEPRSVAPPHQMSGVQPSTGQEFRFQAGAGIPPELVGKTMQETLANYNQLRELALTHPQFQQPPAAPVQQPQAPVAQPAPTPYAIPATQMPIPNTPTPAAAPTAADFWTNPMDAIGAAIDARIAPIAQHTMQQTAQAIDAQMAALPHYAQLRPAVHQMLATLPPNAIADGGVWQRAYQMALGGAVQAGQIPIGGQPAVQQPAAPTAPAQQPQRFAPVQAFFSEQPRPTPNTTVGLNDAQRQMAARMGMSENDYSSWMVNPNQARMSE